MAISAVARKSVTMAYLMLKSNEPYRYAKPELMRGKFAKLQGSGPVPAGDVQTRRPRTQSGASLIEVYESVPLLPVTAPEGLPAGQRRRLGERELEGFGRGCTGRRAGQPTLFLGAWKMAPSCPED